MLAHPPDQNQVPAVTPRRHDDIELLPLTEEHEGLVNGWLSNMDLAHLTTLDVPTYPAPGQARAFILDNQPGKGAYFFLLSQASTGKALGYGALGRIDAKNRSAILGMMIGDPPQRGHGFGTTAVHLMLQFAFDELNLHRIHCEFLAFNQQSRRVCQKVGFREEGVKREACYRAGAYRDVVQVAILAHEYKGRTGA